MDITLINFMLNSLSFGDVLLEINFFNFRKLRFGWKPTL